MQCPEFKEIADSYLKDELSVETTHDVLKHIEACAACRSELAARRETRAQLRRAFADAPEFQIRPDFAFQLRNQLKAQALGKRKTSFNFFAAMMRPQRLAIAACLVVVSVVGIFAIRYRNDNSSELARDRQPTLSSSGIRAPLPAEELSGTAVHLASFELGEAAVGDHRDCAIKYNLPEKPIDLNQAGRKYDAAYIGLAQAVQSSDIRRAGDIKYIEDHSCVYNGTRFAHIVLEVEGRTISLLVAETDAREPNQTGDEVSTCSHKDGFHVSCFGTKRHNIFVVSDLPEADNLRLARRLAPTVAKHIAGAEA